MAKKKDQELLRIQIIIDVVKKSFDSDSELKTRVKLLENILDLKKKAMNDPERFELLEEVRQILFHYSFDELDDIYHGLYEFGDIDEEPEVEENNAPLYKLLSTAKKNQEIELFLEGKKSREFNFVRKFNFEGKFYVLLKNENGEQLYCYVGFNDKEKIVPINDDNLLKYLIRLSKD